MRLRLRRCRPPDSVGTGAGLRYTDFPFGLDLEDLLIGQNKQIVRRALAVGRACSCALLIHSHFSELVRGDDCVLLLTPNLDCRIASKECRRNKVRVSWQMEDD